LHLPSRAIPGLTSAHRWTYSFSRPIKWRPHGYSGWKARLQTVTEIFPGWVPSWKQTGRTNGIPLQITIVLPHLLFGLQVILLNNYIAPHRSSSCTERDAPHSKPDTLERTNDTIVEAIGGIRGDKKEIPNLVRHEKPSKHCIRGSKPSVFNGTAECTFPLARVRRVDQNTY
jgi:hypothetical protein